ncbi:MAG: hypothetical protein K2G35_11265 [Duncaniella sp.]|nr:hypothetical protein [Duncaniella sp.]
MNIDNLRSRMRKGMHEHSILPLLQGGDAYSSEMIERFILKEGTLFPLPMRMKNAAIFHVRADPRRGIIPAAMPTSPGTRHGTSLPEEQSITSQRIPEGVCRRLVGTRFFASAQPRDAKFHPPPC